MSDAPDPGSAPTLPASPDDRPAATIDETVFEGEQGEPPRTLVKTAAGDAPDYPALAPIEDEHYTSGREIARGGMGRILSARDRRLGRRVAIKELLTDDDELAARFEREARITAKLQHPNIIHVYEAGVWKSGEPFYAMNLVVGQPLDKVIRDTPLTMARLALVANVVAVVDALAYAHSQGVIHRDLKPGNVLIGAFGETVVVDWGLAKDLSSSTAEQPSLHPRNSSSSSALETVAGSVMGTPAYMPPEQAAGDAVGATADVYALGAMLYHVIAGKPPYAARNAIELLAMLEVEPPEPLAKAVPNAPPDLVAIIDKAMARDPSQRFPTAREMADELRRFQTGQLVTSYRYTNRELFVRWLRRHRSAVAVGVLAAIVLAVVGGLSVRRIVAERERANAGLAAALADKGQAAEHDKAWSRAAAYYQASLRQHDDLTVRFAAGRAESRMVVPIARHVGESWIHAVTVHGSDVFSVDAAGGVHRWGVTDGRTLASSMIPTPLYAIAVSSDGTQVAVAGDDGVIRMLDPGLHELRTYAGHSGRIWSLAFSPDGQTLASAGEDASVRLWTPTTATSVGRVLGAHTQRVYSVAFSPDGTRLVSASDDRTVRLWNVASGETNVFAQSTAGVRAASFSGDGTRVLFAGWDTKVSVAELDTSTTAPVPAAAEIAQWSEPASLHTAAMSPDGSVIASAGDSGAVRLWDPTTHSLLAVLDGHVGQITSVAFSGDGTRLVSAGLDGTARVWDVAPTLRLARGVGHHDGVFRIAFTRDDKRLVSSSLDKTVRVWNPATGLELGRRVTNEQCGYGAFVIGDGSQFGTVCVGGKIYLWSGADEHLVHTFDAGQQLHFGAILGVSLLATGEGGGVIQIWDIGSTPTFLTKRQGHAHAVYGMRALADGTLLTTSLDSTVRRWSPTLEPLGMWRAKTSDGLIDAMLDPHGRFVIAGGNSFQLYRWSLPDGAPLAPLSGHTGSIWSVDISPDGTRAASASSDGTVRLWNTTDWTSVALRGPRGPVRSVAFSSDGRWLASGHENGAVVLWDVATQQQLRRLGASELGDDGTCGSLDRSAWNDADERSIVARACSEAAPAGFDRILARAHLALDGEVNLVERWTP